GLAVGHLRELTDSVRGQTVEVTFAEYELHRLARSLRVKMAEAGIPPADLTESGLGYANLLFIATVILELRKPSWEATIWTCTDASCWLPPRTRPPASSCLPLHGGQPPRPRRPRALQSPPGW
ncbi:hypothetical protein, partial [Streptomyces sp. C1-2]|uniref:hypothetical protein n=1 Tax=Streptomyces sp. C1-2 TaxID=2720022 RepID=UPI001F0E1A1D